MKRLWTGIIGAAGIMLMILDTKTAISGAYEGILLCVRSVIPSLFPFFLLSGLLTGALLGSKIPLLSGIGRLCRMPKGSESILAVGLLGGYPVGAQAVAQAYHSSQLTCKDARRMLGFCSNAGPSFLFGIVAGQFSAVGYAWVLWVIHILSAILTGMLLPGKSSESTEISPSTALTLTDALQQAIKGMASVCAWVILFRCVIAFLSRWILWLLPKAWQAAVIGILELANGCISLDTIANDATRFVIFSGILAFGGLCVAMQTASVTGSLGMGACFPGKLLQCAISMLLAGIVQSFLFPAAQRMTVMFLVLVACAAFLAALVLLMRKKQKNSSNRQLIGV